MGSRFRPSRGDHQLWRHDGMRKLVPLSYSVEHELILKRSMIAFLEAGGSPAISFYFTLLYPRKEFGFRWAVFQASSCLSNAFAGYVDVLLLTDNPSAMAYGLVQIKNTALAPWQLVFVVEAAVSGDSATIAETSQPSFAVSSYSSFSPIVQINVAS